MTSRQETRREALAIVVDAIAKINIDYTTYARIDDAFDVISEIKRIKDEIGFELIVEYRKDQMQDLVERAKREGVTLRKVSMGDKDWYCNYEHGEVVEVYWEVIDRDSNTLLRANEDDAVEFVQGILDVAKSERG